MLLRFRSRQKQLMGLCRKTQQTVSPPHLLWATHDFVDLFPTICPSSKLKSPSLQFFTVQSVLMSLSILTACLQTFFHSLLPFLR